ncbi:hypothetical protein SF23_19530, partial [Streptomyces sp. MBRL 10]
MPTAPELVLSTDTGSTPMSPGRTYHVGRDPQCDICFDDPRVSWHHAVLRAEGDHWTVEDEHSLNGTWADGHRIREWHVAPAANCASAASRTAPAPSSSPANP